MTPLVSVTMPCYNARATLPMALASLLAQDYQNWECIVVDDGSTDDPQEILEAAADPRFRLVRFEENRGRGAARQAALDAARGKYLAMLDADDWYYPAKLSGQTDALEADPRSVLVSSGMAIVGTDGHIAGVRCRSEVLQHKAPRNSLRMPGFAHAPSMLRADAARNAGYDQALKITEDIDFLLSLLTTGPYCLLPSVHYAYTEHATATRRKILAAHSALRQVWLKRKDRFPIASRFNALKSLCKSATYSLGFALGLGHRLIDRRSRKPGPEETRQHETARRQVESTLSARFGAASLGEHARG